MSVRTRLLEPDDVSVLVALALSAWAPVFDSLRRTLGDGLFARLRPDWRRDKGGSDVVFSTVDSRSVR